MSQGVRGENYGPYGFNMSKADKELKDTDSSVEAKMEPKPEYEDLRIQVSGLLKGKVALVTGGDSGIGRAICVSFAKEGCDLAFVYHSSDEDAKKTKKLIEEKGQSCLMFKGDVGSSEFCQKVVEETMSEFSQIDILVNNAAEQHPQEKFEDITEEQLVQTFRTNVFGYFLMALAVVPHLNQGGSIINTTSVTTYKGSPGLIDYASTKGAVVGFTRSLAGNLVDRGIRVNMVAPGPIWTPLIPSTFSEEDVVDFGKDTPMGRPGQPYEVAACFVFLASEQSSYITGQCLHPNGGEIVNG